MQVFKTFFKVLRKHFPVAVIYITVFLAVGVVMTFMNDSRALFEQTRLNVCLFDEDNTPASRALCGLIGKKHTVVTLENDTDTILDALYYDRVNYVLTVRRGYAEKLAAGQTEGLFESRHMHDSYATVYMEQFLNEYAATAAAFLAGGDSPDAAAAHAASAMEAESEVRVAEFDTAQQSEVPETVAAFFRYLPYLILSVLMSALCPVLLAMTKKEIRYRTDCSGIRPLRFQNEILAGSTVFVTGIWLIFMLTGMLMSGAVFHGLAWLGVLNSFVFTLFSAAFTLFVATFEPSENVVSIITQIVTLGMCFLCGVFVDQSLLGDGVLSAARFLPAYWYIRVNRMLEGTEGYDAQFAAKAIAMELAFAAVMALLTVMLRKSHVRTPKQQRDPA